MSVDEMQELLGYLEGYPATPERAAHLFARVLELDAAVDLHLQDALVASIKLLALQRENDALCEVLRFVGDARVVGAA